eukprot:57271-Pyramimonas_sp.AAC.4
MCRINGETNPRTLTEVASEHEKSNARLHRRLSRVQCRWAREQFEKMQNMSKSPAPPPKPAPYHEHILTKSPVSSPSKTTPQKYGHYYRASCYIEFCFSNALTSVVVLDRAGTDVSVLPQIFCPALHTRKRCFGGSMLQYSRVGGEQWWQRAEKTGAEREEAVKKREEELKQQRANKFKAPQAAEVNTEGLSWLERRRLQIERAEAESKAEIERAEAEAKVGTMLG